MAIVGSSLEFEKAYHRLNPEQKQAVDTIDGPVMVIAGPGTGKTQILAMRIANILLKTDTNPSSILALTFTESGANAMRKRLVSLIGETAYYVRIQTFHSFCIDVIQTNPEYFPLGGLGQPLADLERFHIFERILLDNNFEYIKPLNAPLHYLKAALNAVQNLKREGITPDQFRKILEQEKQLLETEGEQLKKTERTKREKQLQKNTELLQVYILYQQKIREVGTFDFEDMITLTVEAFQTHELLLQTYQEKLLYLLVDEYQDTNSAQNTVVDLLAAYWGKQANVFVVGDPNQSIYRFQGASLENTYGFLARYSNATTISLKENYRSTQPILDAAKGVIDHNQPPTIPLTFSIEQHLQSQSQNRHLIELYEPSSNTLEYVYIAEKISSLIAQGESPENIAVIFRNNAESAPIADALVRWGIPYEIEGGSDVLIDPIIQQLLLLLKVVRDLRTGIEDLEYFTLLNYRWIQLSSLIILKLTRFASQHRTQLFTVISSFSLVLSDTNQLSMDAVLLNSDEVLENNTRHTLQSNTELGKEFLTTLSADEVLQLQKVVQFTQQLIELSGSDAFLTFPAWFEKVINETGYLQYLLNEPKSIEYLNRLNSLFSEVKKQLTTQPQLKLHDFLQNIAIMQQYNIGIPEEDLNIKRDAVRLITAHKSKGLEWQHVFITQVIDKKWGNTTKRDLLKLPEGILQHTVVKDDEQQDDERRLFYVALTRAKSHIYITAPKTITSGNASRETSPSLFLEEIPKDLIHKNDTFEAQQETSVLLRKLLTTNHETSTPSTEEKAFIDSIIEKFKMSSTALNTYLDCPYKFKLEKLLGVPKAKEAYLAYGTAVHKALEDLFSYLKNHNGLVPPLNMVLSSFEKALQKELLTPEEFQIRLAHGNTILTMYYQEYQKTFIAPLTVEKQFGSGFSRPHLDDIPLAGRVDKIELIDQSLNTIKVIDYKTGKPKTRGQIEGKTKDSNGSYKRQLIFYKLLAELDRTFQYQVQEAEFDFVEPNDRGKLKKETFHISQEEVDALKVLIRDVMQRIRNQEFPKITDTSICAKCDFKHHCWPNGISTQ